MNIVEVQVNPDHLERLATSCSPISALIELIWNSLDADANQVNVVFKRNALDGIEEIQVIDNGHGFSHQDAVDSFKNLGGSKKRNKNRTKNGRFLHGREGKGRFRAFRLGSCVKWITTYREDDVSKEFQIEGFKENIKRFKISEPKITRSTIGTVVKITNLSDFSHPIQSAKNIQKATEEFALYLRQYQQVQIYFDSNRINPAVLEKDITDYILPVTLPSNVEVMVDLTIIEWLVSTERALYLCDQDGFTLHKEQGGIQAPGFSFTAYLKSEYIRTLGENGLLEVGELSPDLKVIVDTAREKMREHFRIRSSLQVIELVDQWKEEDIYPYKGEPDSALENAERQIFDVVALNLNEYLPDFQRSSSQSKKMQFRLLRNAIETSPSSVQAIIHDVLNLPLEKQEEFAELLERTSLEAMITASKMVADRLNFLQGLEILVFDPNIKRKTLERSQLHRIVADHTWIFGEEYNLTVSDKSLTNVLKRHIDFSGKELLDESPVLREDGSQGIVDLMLSKVIPQPDAKKNHHLIIELKRPKVSIGNGETSQLKDYAIAIATDDRFRDTDTRWDFWAVSNDLAASVRLEANQNGRPQGLLLDNPEYRIRIWVKTWGQVIESCRSRLKLFQEKLNYASDENSGLEYLQKVHNQYLPKDLMR